MKLHMLIGLKVMALLLAFSMSSASSAQTEDVCAEIHKKPDLSSQQITQAEFVHYLVVISGLKAPSQKGKTQQQFYQEELSLLVDAGYPASLKDINADRTVTRRYYSSVVFQIAKEAEPAFAAKYSGCKDEQCKMDALVDSGWMNTKTGKIYRAEILSVLCSKDLTIKEEGAAIDIEPVLMMGAELEVPASPI